MKNDEKWNYIKEKLDKYFENSKIEIFDSYCEVLYEDIEILIGYSEREDELGFSINITEYIKNNNLMNDEVIFAYIHIEDISSDVMNIELIEDNYKFTMIERIDNQIVNIKTIWEYLLKQPNYKNILWELYKKKREKAIEEYKKEKIVRVKREIRENFNKKKYQQVIELSEEIKDNLGEIEIKMLKYSLKNKN